MSLVFVVTIFVFLLAVGVVFFFFQQRLDHLQNQLRLNLNGTNQIFEQQMAHLSQQMVEGLKQASNVSSQTNQQINERLDNAARVFGDLQKSLGKLDEANQKIYEVGKDIGSLQEILKRPKARGSLGEFFLAELMAEMLPRERYELQYRFKNNEAVDAVIRVGESLLPIDSKFPLENFRRVLELDNDARLQAKKQFAIDVKRHIDSIARKYILPEEATFDFAFMYIMAENVFYEVISRDDELGQSESLQAYALKKRVIPVSPNSFYAYLNTLMHALRAERLQKNIFEAVGQIRHLGVDLLKFRDDFDKIGFHLNNLRSSFDTADKRLSRYQDRLEKVGDVGEIESPVKLVANETK